MGLKRLAAIDVGTNTIRCIVIEPHANEDFRVLDDERAMVRLGESLSITGEISTAAWKRAREALCRMRKIVDGFGVTLVEAVATSAVRKAGNGRAFIEAMERDTGIRIRVISGDEEAELAALSARHHFDMNNTRYAMIDIGGGSVEVIMAAGEHIEKVFSVELGAVFLTERFLKGDPIPKKHLKRLEKHIRKELRSILPDGEFVPQRLIGSGGTMTTMGNMVTAMRREPYDSVQGYEVLRSEVVHLLAMLERKTQGERRAVPGLSPERADIIVAGVSVVNQLMENLGANVLTINERGIREGLILKSLHKHGLVERATVGRDWRTSVEDLARSCHVELVHAHHVKALSLELFDAVVDPFDMEARSRDLLEAAAVLHDVGYFISYARHHKHSYHLIRHADLFDFSPREKEIIANVARYHRRALPKRKHAGFGQMGDVDQAEVRRLAALLRLADGLDRRRNSHVASLDCKLIGDTFHVALRGEGDLSVELYGGQEKGDLFEAAFRRRLVLES